MTASSNRAVASSPPDEHYGPPGRNDGRRFAPGRFGDETTEHRGGDGRQPRGEARYGHPRHADPPERALPASSTAAITLAGQCGSCRLKMPPATSMRAPAQWSENWLRHEGGTCAKYDSANAAAVARARSRDNASRPTRPAMWANR